MGPQRVTLTYPHLSADTLPQLGCFAGAARADFQPHQLVQHLLGAATNATTAHHFLQGHRVRQLGYTGLEGDGLYPPLNDCQQSLQLF